MYVDYPPKFLKDYQLNTEEKELNFFANQSRKFEALNMSL